MSKHVDITKTITHLSLCSGYEGIGLGLRSILPNLREVAYVEREGLPVANLVAKMEAGHLDAAPIFTDVKTFPYGKFRGCVDVLSGGFPCQPFSTAGKRKGVEDPRHLFPYIADGIRECQPGIVFLENVEGVISCKTADGESVLQYVLGTLEEMGYRATAGIFSADEVGAPHQRKRVFILGRRLANAEREQNNRERRLDEQGRHGMGRHTETTQPEDRESITMRANGLGEEMANSDSERLEGVRQCNHSQGREAPHRQPRGGNQAWPSRPGEHQHEWEEPRLAETKPKLGRAVDGPSCRVDRLRLLGNGVVPQTAAKAFVTLLEKLDLN